MDSFTITVIYVPFLMMSGFVLITELFKFIRYRSSPMLALAAFSIVSWVVCMLAVVLAGYNNMEAVLFLWNAAIFFVSLVVTTQFFVIHNTLFPERKLAKWLIILLFLMPALNAIVVFTPLNFLIREVEVVGIYPYIYIVNNRGIWFWVHTAQSYILVAITLVVLVRGHLRKPKFYRLSSYLVIVGMGITIVSNIATLLNLTPPGLDISAIAASVSIIFYYWASSNSDRNLYVRQARSRAFNYMEDFVLILGKEGYVTDFNNSAGRWFSSIGIDVRQNNLEGLLEALKVKGAKITDSPETKEGKDISYDNGGFNVVLHLHVHEMVNDKQFDGNSYGSIAFFTNVTKNRALLDKLEKKAGMDFLTGLPNRVSYDGAKKRMDSAEYLPVSVVVCDVNYLKQVNDTMGHKYGDVLLQTMAEILANARRKGDFVARIGGDEFVFLLPHTDENTARELVTKIREEISKYKNLPFELSLAMGVATKIKITEPFGDVVAAADGQMYQDKRRTKEERRKVMA
ncbi:MAG: diguanylate cyclase [Defluviitaleaceae bacterium]|nr:diguanylate cyclase [Defluviitaleaceae bacterium]